VVLVFSELVAFGLFLGAFIVTRAVRPAVFASGQTELDLALAGYNTIVLVTSGWAAAKGAASARADQGRRARLWLFLAMALGGAFVTIKLVEYARGGGGIGSRRACSSRCISSDRLSPAASASVSSFSPSSAVAPVLPM
jgi:nitric oxide reductase NorE protein